MEQKKYLAQKKLKKKSALKAVWVILLLAVIFIVVVAKFALSGGDDVIAIFNGMPSSDEVYSVSKQFVLPTLKGSGAKFSDDGYQFGKKQDSVFVIRSFVETTLNSGDVEKTNYEIVLRYKGGAASNENSWEVLNLNEE